MARKKPQPIYKGTKKEAIAQAIVRKGNGTIRINSRKLELVQPIHLQTYIREPLLVAGDTAQGVNVSIHVSGSGTMSQAVATRASLAKALVGFTKDENLRKAMLEYDRMMLVDDPRRTEPKKPLGPKARKKKQHSKR